MTYLHQGLFAALALAISGCSRGTSPPTHAIQLMGQQVGVLTRTVEVSAGGRSVTSERAWKMAVDGAVVESSSRTDLQLDDRDRLVSYARSGDFGSARQAGFPGAVFILEEARGPLSRAASGDEVVLSVLDPTSLGVVPATLLPGEGDVRFRLPHTHGLLRVDDNGEWTELRQGPVRVVAGPVETVDEPPDVAELLGRPSAVIERPRRARVLRVRTGGEELTIEAPLRDEIPRPPVVDRSDERARWRKAEPGIEVGSPELRAIVEPLAAVAPDRRTLVEALVPEVAARLSSAPEPGLPSALGALAQGSGNCNDHAVLFVALARTAGVPARRIAGLVYLDEPAPGFYPHEWAEVWMDEPVGWVPVDPAFEQRIADAARIPLVTGGQAPLWTVLDQLGTRSVEIVEVR